MKAFRIILLAGVVLVPFAVSAQAADLAPNEAAASEADAFGDRAFIIVKSAGTFSRKGLQRSGVDEAIAILGDAGELAGLQIGGVEFFAFKVNQT